MAAGGPGSPDSREGRSPRAHRPRVMVKAASGGYNYTITVYLYLFERTMALNIKNPEVERLVAEVAALTGESKTEAVRQALSERRQRLRVRLPDGARADRIQRFLSREVWSQVPPDQLGCPPSREERERILGLGQDGV